MRDLVRGGLPLDDGLVEEARQLAGRTVLAAVLVLLTALAAGVTYLFWLRAARDNAEVLDGDRQRRDRRLEREAGQLALGIGRDLIPVLQKRADGWLRKEPALTRRLINRWVGSGQNYGYV